MTKEELAKKRGIVVSKETVSPSDALVTTKPITKKQAAPKKKPAVNDVELPEKSISAPKEVNKEPDSSSIPIPAPAENPSFEKPRNKGGRPKTRTEAVKILNIAIPISVYNDMNDHAVALFGNNMTEYINSLIKKDLEANLDNYKKISDMMKRAIGN